MRTLITTFILAVTTLLITLLYHPSSPQEVHYHAGFHVYLNENMVDFSSLRYMHLEQCGQEEHKEDDQIEKAHLHDGIGDVVHVHRPQATWGDLFSNLSYSLPPDLPVQGFDESGEITNILESPILPNQSIVIIVGNKPSELSFVPLNHIQKVEENSESCGDSQ